MAIAPVPAQLLPKSLATPSLLAHITTAKFVDGMPLYRQEPQFARLGVPLGRATMAGWMIKLGGVHVVPIVNLLHELMLSDPLIHCDETRLQVLKSDKAPTADHWMWVRASGPPGRRIILFDYDASRAGAVPKRLLEGYQGILLTDGYEPYEAVARALTLVHAGCFAHVRRKFDEARKAQRTERRRQPGARSRWSSSASSIWSSGRCGTRISRSALSIGCACAAELSAPIMAKFHAWLEALAPQVLPQSLLGKAVHYTLGSVVEADDVPRRTAKCRSTTTAARTRSARSSSARKGWLFSDTVKGAVASANLYSIVETAKANGVEPHAYLSLLFARLPHAKTVEDFEALLPWNVKAEIAAAASH